MKLKFDNTFFREYLKNLAPTTTNDLKSLHLYSVSDDVVGLQFNQQSKAFMSRKSDIAMCKQHVYVSSR